MQPSSNPLPLDILHELWFRFTQTGQLLKHEAEAMDPAVLQSWQRCIARLNPNARPRHKNSDGLAFASVLKAQANLIGLTRPFIEDIYQFIEHSDAAILLTDGSARVINMLGDHSMISAVAQSGCGLGSYWSEGSVGTTAFGLVLSEGQSMQVVGAEHFLAAKHHWTTSAAPIYDIRGRIIALLGIITPASVYSSHTLGLVMSAARAIGNQIQADWMLSEANQRLAEVNALIGSISEGVLALSEEGDITHMNDTAAEMLQFSPSPAVGRPLNELIRVPAPIAQAIQRGEELTNVEMTIERLGRPQRLLVTVRPIIRGAARHPSGYIALLSPIKQVHKLVQKQAGAQATLTLDDVQGQSSSMRRVLHQAQIAARGTAPVLLYGEVGVGKNHLAQAIHNEGNRAGEPYLAINCQAIPHELMAMELLGREKSADVEGYPSKFELADGGTLLLDQAENLSLEMQAALLQLIETGHVMRLHGRHPIQVDVRIMVATSANLETLVTEGSFLPHLFYRFGVFNITLPPLRDRMADLPLLAERILARLTEQTGQPAWIDEETLAILRRYPWPGNVRELESVL